MSLQGIRSNDLQSLPWGKSYVKFSPADYKPVNVQEAIQEAEDVFPGAINRLPNDVFIGLSREKSTNREVASIGSETGKLLYEVTNARPGHLDELMIDVAEAIDAKKVRFDVKI